MLHFMNKRHLTFAAATLAVAGVAAAFTVNTPKGYVHIIPMTEDIIKVAVTPSPCTSPAAPTQAVALDENDVPGTHAVLDDSLYTVTTPTTRVELNRHTGLISFYDKDGNLLLQESTGILNGPETQQAAFRNLGNQYFAATGERGHNMILNGDTLTFYNRQNYGYGEGDPRLSQTGINVPMLLSTKGYGILFDDHSKATLSLGNDEMRYTADTPRPLSYYFINGEGTPAGVTKGYTQLSGRQPLPPLWTLGYITSKYGYHDQRETLAVVDSLKTRNYPVDGLVLDLYWYGTETDMGRFAWNPTQWPDPAGMLRTLKDKGVNVVTINQPYINKKGAIDNYNELNAAGLLTHDAQGNTHDVQTWVGEAGMLDVANPGTREWIWGRIKPLTAEGIAGWWGDLGEPEVHPSTIRHANGMTAEQFHNVYGNVWSKLIYDGLRRDFPEMRPMLLMRGGTAGLQRYGVMPWTTDVSRSWAGLRPQVRLMLQAGLSGLGYMSSDIGGFAVDPKEPYQPELYVRWLQLGTFTPQLRTHAQYLPNPYNYPDQEKILHQYINMRYEWLPYNYTLAYENSTTGAPLARPLYFRDAQPSKKLASIDDEYLWGDNVLVAPVLTKGARSRSVYFPTGEWVSWWNPAESFHGGRSYTVKAPLETLPLFVRKGAFIPQYTGKVENTSDYNPARLDIHYIPSAQRTSYTLFDDDRKSPTSLEDHAYTLTTFTGECTSRSLQLTITPKGEYPGMPTERMITFTIPNVSKAPRTLSLLIAAGDTEVAIPMEKAASPKAIRQYGYSYDPSTRTLTIRAACPNAPVTIQGLF